jgi:hypothetical protein
MTPPGADGLTIAGWLGARVPPAPPALDARMREALGAESLGARAGELPARALDAAERLFVQVLAEMEHGARDAAVSLLAADALITDASAYAGADLETADDRLREGMGRLASLASLAKSRYRVA